MMNWQLNQPPVGSIVGYVAESKSADFAIGDTVKAPMLLRGLAHRGDSGNGECGDGDGDGD